jgi:hypothetical protein
MLSIERLHAIDGHLLAGFFVRNGAGKVVAIGAFCKDGFVMPARKRYARDIDLCRKVAEITGEPIKWNLSLLGLAVHQRDAARVDARDSALPINSPRSR